MQAGKTSKRGRMVLHSLWKKNGKLEGTGSQVGCFGRAKSSKFVSETRIAEGGFL